MEADPTRIFQLVLQALLASLRAKHLIQGHSHYHVSTTTFPNSSAEQPVLVSCLCTAQTGFKTVAEYQSGLPPVNKFQHYQPV